MYNIQIVVWKKSIRKTINSKCFLDCSYKNHFSPLFVRVEWTKKHDNASFFQPDEHWKRLPSVTHFLQHTQCKLLYGLSLMIYYQDFHFLNNFLSFSTLLPSLFSSWCKSFEAHALLIIIIYFSIRKLSMPV